MNKTWLRRTRIILRRRLLGAALSPGRRWGRAALPAAVVALFVAAAPGLGAQTAGRSAALESRRAEPICFDLMRRLRDAPVGEGRMRLRRQLDLWRGRAHERAVKVGGDWVDAKELQRRRERYIVALAEAEKALKEIPSRGPRTPAERAALKRMRADANHKLQAAARIWPDPLIRNFLLGQAALLAGDARQAERLFDQCVRDLPLVAAFYQGRAMARARLDKPLDAAADWVAVSRLRPTRPEVIDGLRDALADAPGGMINTRAFKEATVRLRELEDAEDDRGRRRRSSSSRRGVAWLAPGDDWQGRKDSLPTPPVDMLFTRKTVAAPVTETGVLLVDAKALEGALEVLLEVAPGEYAPVAPARMRSSSIRDLDLPLAAVRARGVVFEPAPVDESPVVRPGDELAVVLHSLPGEMDTAAPREFVARVKAVEDGAPILNAWPRPGESGGPAFAADGRLLTWLVGRTDPFADGGGEPAALKPADVAAYVAAAARARTRSSRSRDRAPQQPRRLTGRTFTLHILAGQGGS